MYKLKKKIGEIFTSKYVGTGPSSYKKRIYRAAVSQRLRNTALVSAVDPLNRSGQQYFAWTVVTTQWHLRVVVMC